MKLIKWILDEKYSYIVMNGWSVATTGDNTSTFYKWGADSNLMEIRTKGIIL